MFQLYLSYPIMTMSLLVIDHALPLSKGHAKSIACFYTRGSGRCRINWHSPAISAKLAGARHLATFIKSLVLWSHFKEVLSSIIFLKNKTAAIFRTGVVAKTIPGSEIKVFFTLFKTSYFWPHVSTGSNRLIKSTTKFWLSGGRCDISQFVAADIVCQVIF